METTAQDNQQVELRATTTGTDDKMNVKGYAAVYGERTLIGNKRGYTVYEVIEPGAFDDVISGDTVFRYNHNDDNGILARTTNSTLRMTTDDKGLKIDADIIDTALGKDIYKQIQRGDLSKMSIGFSVGEQELETDPVSRTITRHIQKVGKLEDVSVVAFPAYPGTSIATRSFFNDEFFETLSSKDAEERRKRLFLRARL